MPTNYEKFVQRAVDNYLAGIERAIIAAHEHGDRCVTVRIYHYSPGDRLGEIGDRVLNGIVEHGYRIAEVKPGTNYWGLTALATITWTEDTTYAG